MLPEKTWRQSALQEIMICPRRFEQIYVLGRQRGESAASLVGTTVHAAIELAARAVKDEGRLLEAQELVSYGTELFRLAVERDMKSPDPIPWESPSQIEERTHEVAQLIALFASHQEEVWRAYGMPTLIEYEFQVPWREWTLQGTLDCVTASNVIIDWKTSRRRWPPGHAQKKLQRVFYATAFKQLRGTWPNKFVFVVLTRGTKEPSFQIVETVPVPQEREFLETLLRAYDRQREAGIYPLNTSSNLCSQHWCSFWSTCPASILGDQDDNP